MGLLWPQLEGEWSTLTQTGRSAIDLACQLWQLGRDDEVLVPAYNCGSEVDPYLRHRCRVVLYRVGRAGDIDVDDLRRRATPRTRVLHVTHYFGWSQELQALRDWCRERNILLLEDCALALFSSGPAGPLGSLGDASVLSLTKTLPLPDGGAIVLRHPPHGPMIPLRRPPATRIARRILPLLKARALARAERFGLLPLMQRVLARDNSAGAVQDPAVRPDMPASYYFEDGLAARSISRLSRGLLRRIDPAAVVASRRENYRVLRAGLEGCPGVEFLFADLPPGACPLVLPMLVEERDRWIRELNARAIPAIPWWSGYHRELDFGPFPEACHLKDHVVALPVHQDLDADHMLAIGEHARSIAARIAAAQRPEVHRGPCGHQRTSCSGA